MHARSIRFSESGTTAILARYTLDSHLELRALALLRSAGMTNAGRARKILDPGLRQGDDHGLRALRISQYPWDIRSEAMIRDPGQHTILVSGATGRQGGAVARHLLERGFQIRALTRHPDGAAARALADRGTEIVEGNFDDRASLDRALAGAYGAFSVQNSYEAGVEKEIRQGKTFAEAARDAGVAHLVYSSVGGAERRTGIAHFESKWQIEEHIRALDGPATILRPVFFMDNWVRLRDTLLGGQLPQPLSPETMLQQIAVDDIGAFAALAFANPDEWIGRALEIAGDERSMTKVAETFSHVLNREVRYVQVPWAAFEQQAGAETALMFRWFESDGYKADIRALRQVYPPLASLETFLRAQDWSSPGAETTPHS